MNNSKVSLDEPCNQTRTQRKLAINQKLLTKRLENKVNKKPTVRGVKNITTEKLFANKLLDSFLCKSIEPSSTKTREEGEKETAKYQPVKSIVERSEKLKNLSFKEESSRKKESSSVLSEKQPSKGFLTRIKKKSV
jgi:SAM-dependent MidA family methyltransferase